MTMNGEKVREFWPELVQADADRNSGMPLELFSAETYGRMDGVSAETYIISVLRAERERRQELDRIVRDRAELDETIDSAISAGLTVQSYLAKHLTESKFSHGAAYREEDISAHYLAKISARLLERLVSDGA